MKLGILSDIHGDLESFDRALELFSAFDVSAIVCAGDVVEKGSHDDEVVEKLRDLKIRVVQGNHDENAIRHFRLGQSMRDESEVPLREETIAYLDSLPTKIEFDIDECSILMAHAIPSSNAGWVFHDETTQRLSKPLKKDLSRTECAFIIVGHTHFPFDVRFKDKRILNPGSTCNLRDRDSHTVGVLDLASGDFDVRHLHDRSVADILRADVT